MAIIRRRAGVDDDIAEIALYLLNYSEDAAIRFVDAVEISLRELADRPQSEVRSSSTIFA